MKEWLIILHHSFILYLNGLLIYTVSSLSLFTQISNLKLNILESI